MWNFITGVGFHFPSLVIQMRREIASCQWVKAESIQSFFIATPSFGFLLINNNRVKKVKTNQYTVFLQVTRFITHGWNLFRDILSCSHPYSGLSALFFQSEPNVSLFKKWIILQIFRWLRMELTAGRLGTQLTSKQYAIYREIFIFISFFIFHLFTGCFFLTGTPP